MDAIQLYTLRDLDLSVAELLELVADAGFDGVEYAYEVPEADPDVVREALATNGLAVPGAHVPIDALEDDLEATVEQYRGLDCERLVVPYLADELFESHEAVVETAERLDTLAVRLEEHDYPLLYHNHSAEFASLHGETAFDVLVAETDHVGFELDVGLTANAGVDPAAVVERHGDRIDLLHCTDTHLDTPAPEHASFGTGDVDYEAVFAAADDAGIEWYVYENGTTDAQREELEHAREAFLGR